MYVGKKFCKSIKGTHQGKWRVLFVEDGYNKAGVSAENPPE
jgi:hypothetical protein